MDSLFGLDHASGTDDKVVLLSTVYNRVDLAFLTGLLKDAEIPFEVKERGSGGILQVLAGYSMYGADILVPADALDEAQALLDASEADAGEETDEEDEANAEGEIED